MKFSLTLQQKEAKYYNLKPVAERDPNCYFISGKKRSEIEEIKQLKGGETVPR